MKKKPHAKRECAAVTDIEFCGEVDSITTCGAIAQETPFKTYVPLCAANRLMAEMGELKVFTGDVIARFRL